MSWHLRRWAIQVTANKQFLSPALIGGTGFTSTNKFLSQSTVTSSPERWPTKAKEAVSLHEVRLILLDNNLVFHVSWHIYLIKYLLWKICLFSPFLTKGVLGLAWSYKYSRSSFYLPSWKYQLLLTVFVSASIHVLFPFSTIVHYPCLLAQFMMFFCHTQTRFSWLNSLSLLSLLFQRIS